MYLARNAIGGKTQFVIRESYRQGDAYLCRDLFFLGPEPQKFIVYPGGNAFYIDGAVEEGIRSLGSEPPPDGMETIFWPFLRPEIRLKLEPFRRRELKARGGRTAAEAAVPAAVHVFDQRRIHFLKTGQMTPRAPGGMPASVLRMFQHKSRDEIEQGFIGMEGALRPREYKAYTYVSFNLQQFFHQHYATTSPEFLEQDAVDAHFIEQVCRLQSDPGFWSGMDAGHRLNDYLVRYAVMYFDHDYPARSFAADYIRDFMNRHRDYRPPASVALRMEEIAGIFGQSREALKQMNRADLWRLYRRRAQDLHPDKGGDHERFVKLNEAYHNLLRAKR